MWQIVINGPGYFDTSYDLPEGVTTLGRADENDIVLSGDLVSRKHARIHVEGGQLSAEDMGSRNGTRLNGAALTKSQTLKVGDTLNVGENTLSVRKATIAENAKTEMVSSAHEGIHRFGQGVDIDSAVILAKNVRDSLALRLLDNVAPFDAKLADLPAPAAPVPYESLLLLYQTAQRLAAATALEGFLEETVDRLMARVSCTTAVVLLRHPSGVLRPAVVRHGGKLERGEVPVSDAIVEAALSKGAAIAVADVRDDQRFARRESVILYGADQVLCIPIGAQPPFAGVLYLNKQSRDEAELDQLLELSTAIGHLMGSAVEKFELRSRGPDEDKLRQVLERSLPPEVVDRKLTEFAQHGPARLSFLDERLVTLLCLELEGLTRKPPAVAAELVTDFHQRLMGAVFSFDGAIASSAGDKALAVFGAPYSRGDDALRAVRAALALRGDWNRAVKKRPADQRCELKVSLHTGKVFAGTVGGSHRLEFTVLGEAITLAERVRALAQGSQVLVTGKTLAAIGARFDVLPKGERTFEDGARVALFEVLEEEVGQSTLSSGDRPRT